MLFTCYNSFIVPQEMIRNLGLANNVNTAQNLQLCIPKLSKQSQSKILYLFEITLTTLTRYY